MRNLCSEVRYTVQDGTLMDKKSWIQKYGDSTIVYYVFGKNNHSDIEEGASCMSSANRHVEKIDLQCIKKKEGKQ